MTSLISILIRNQPSTRKKKESNLSLSLSLSLSGTSYQQGRRKKGSNLSLSIFLYLLISLSLSLSIFIREELLTRSKKASNLAVFPHGAADTQTHSRKWRRKTHLATLAPFFRLFLHSLFASTVFWGLTINLQLWMELFFTLLLFSSHSRAPAAGKPENSIWEQYSQCQNISNLPNQQTNLIKRWDFHFWRISSAAYYSRLFSFPPRFSLLCGGPAQRILISTIIRPKCCKYGVS